MLWEPEFKVTERDGRKIIEMTFDDSDQFTFAMMTKVLAEHFPGIPYDHIQISNSIRDTTPCCCGGHSGESFDITLRFEVMPSSD